MNEHPVEVRYKKAVADFKLPTYYMGRITVVKNSIKRLTKLVMWESNNELKRKGYLNKLDQEKEKLTKLHEHLEEALNKVHR